MPSIEIVSVGCTEPVQFSGSKHFGVLIEQGTESHHNLFNKELKEVTGCIAHIGNKDHELQNFEFCFANELIEWDDEEIEIPEVDLTVEGEPENWGQNQAFYYEFRKEIQKDLKALFTHMLFSSPQHEALFFTRWQFGPEIGEEFEEMTFDVFWSEHACKHLRWNTLYRIKDSANRVAGSD